MTKDPALRKNVRRLGFAWLALVLLMLTSLGSAYLKLGAGNLWVGLAIASIKTSIVLAVFMKLLREQVQVRLVAAVALCTWLLLVGLSSIDYLTRPPEPAAFQGNGK